MSKIVKVGMADLKVGKAPETLTTLGLGSCVGITLYDRQKKVGGMAHVMLPDSTQIKNNKNLAKFADTGIDELLNQLLKEGVNRSKLEAKIAGGAQMFEFNNMDDTLRIGARNIQATKTKLAELRIPIVASEVGANYGRTIELNLDTGVLLIKTIGHGHKEI
ncbi:MAG: chemotaxis protein CheD [Epulopiscium sp. Nele67-Bin005]|nr:MAG: chemotaxis protein CheD [Epulopiscium sp. Nele67-Bin005]